MNQIKNLKKNTPLRAIMFSVVISGAIASQAQAQTNVTIYGRVDAGIDYQSNQVNTTTGQRGGQWGTGGNSWGTSMFGFTGNEDLGGGLKAIFTLENGFNASNGQVNGGSGLWTRRSFVGLTGGFGTVKIGRDLTLPSDITWSIDPTGQQNLSTATLVGGRNWPQESNQVQYISPGMGGFTAQGAYGFGGVAGENKPNSTGGVALTYVQPAFSLVAMYDFAADANGQYSSLFQDSKETTLGGTVTIDKLKLFAGWENLSAPAVTSGPDKANHFWLGANYQLTPALTLIGAAYHVKLNQNVGSANLFMLGTNYSLSKRTLLYASIGTIRNGANTDFQVEAGGPTPGLTGQNQNAFYTGVSHSF